MNEKHRYVIEEAATSLAHRGLRVISFARGRTLVDLEFTGLIGLHDPPRPGVDQSIKLLQESDVKVCMITGDGQATASAIASMLGIQTDGKLLLSGAEVDSMSDMELQRVADKVAKNFILGNQKFDVNRWVSHLAILQKGHNALSKNKLNDRYLVHT